MDPRQPKRSCGTARGRARGQQRPRVQSQPVYRPRFESPPPPQHVYRATSQPGYQHQPMSYDSTTWNDHNYASYDMDQMWSPRESTAAQFEEDEEDLDFVPETQPQVDEEEEEAEDDEVQEVPPKKADRKMWDAFEEETLAKCWIKISVDRQVGDRQRRVAFWKRITKHYASLVPTAVRTHHQLNSKWNQMHPLMQAFNGYYVQAVYLHRMNKTITLYTVYLHTYTNIYMFRRYVSIKAGVTTWTYLRGPKRILQNSTGRRFYMREPGAF
jgi:hypothetical protein